jgi:hypothetical protein
MGRGGYLGGSTIINLRRDGWSSAGTKKSKKKNGKKKAVSPEVKAARKAKAEAKRRDVFNTAMKKYARKCGVAYLDGRPFPVMPSAIQKFMKGRETEVPALVRANEFFTIEQEKRREIAEKRKPQFARESAAFFIMNQARLEAPENLKRLLSETELQEFLTGLETNPVYILTLKQLRKRKRKTEERQEQQRLKIAKVVVETKPRTPRMEKNQEQ